MSSSVPSPTLALAEALIRRPSVTPDDAGCHQLLMVRLAAIGFTTMPLQFGEVSNFWAVRGESGPLFCFAGHSDVVPTGPETAWRHPPFEPRVEDGMLYGRGAADMKGSLAGMVETSNVNAVDEFTQIISLARQFEMHMKMMKTVEENSASASQLLRLS